MNATQKCKTCKIEKSITEFYRDASYSHGFSYKCKECSKQYQKDYNRRFRQKVTDASRIKRQKIKKILVDENGGKCCICGYNRYVGALEFHHQDSSKKDFHVSSTGVNKARREAKKCILVCSNCHMELHAGMITF